METEGLYYVIYVAAGVYLLASAYEYLSSFLLNKKIKNIRASQVPALSLSFDEAMDILDTVVAHVISDMELVYNVKDVKYIKNVDGDIKEATNKVMELLSPNIHDNLLMFVTREYIITYISRNVRAFVMAYLDTRK